MTTRIDLGTLVASAVIRNPVTLARAAATVDDISGGRLVLGLGAGTAGDARAPTAGRRRRRGRWPTASSDVVGALEALWAGEPDFVGDHAAYGDVLYGSGRARTRSTVHDDRGPRSARPGARGRARRRVEHVRRRGVRPAGARTSSGRLARRVPVGPADAAVRGAPARPGVRAGGPSSSATARCNRWPTSRRTSPRSSAPRPPGFDEVVVYWPDGERGDRFWSDPDVHAEALTRLAH